MIYVAYAQVLLQHNVKVVQVEHFCLTLLVFKTVLLLPLNNLLVEVILVVVYVRSVLQIAVDVLALELVNVLLVYLDIII